MARVRLLVSPVHVCVVAVTLSVLLTLAVVLPTRVFFWLCLFGRELFSRRCLIMRFFHRRNASPSSPSVPRSGFIIPLRFSEGVPTLSEGV